MCDVSDGRRRRTRVPRALVMAALRDQGIEPSWNRERIPALDRPLRRGMDGSLRCHLEER